MDPLTQATMLNNEGVHLLDSGEITGSIQLFERIVVLLKDFTHSCSGDKVRSIPSLDGPKEIAASQPVKTCESQANLQQLTGAKLDGLQNGHCYVYDRPLLLPTQFATSTQQDIDSYMLTLTSYIMFNFALACHQYGKLSGREAPLSQASNLYDLVLTILCRSDIDNSTHSVFKCLALNNLAQLHYEACEYEKSQHCVACLYDLIIWTECLDSPSSRCHLSETEVEEIKLNLIHLHPPSSAKAA
jgi:hypothetical protein